MFRKMICLAIVSVVCVGVGFAEEIRGVITKIDGNKVTFQKITFNKDTKSIDKGDPQTAEVDASTKISQGKFNKDTKKLEAGDAVTDGLKNEMFTKIGEKGVGATVEVEGGKIKSIIVGGKGKGKAKTE